MELPTNRACGRLQTTIEQIDPTWTFFLPRYPTGHAFPEEDEARLVPRDRFNFYEDKKVRIVVIARALPDHRSRLLVKADDDFWREEGQYLWSRLEDRIPELSEEDPEHEDGEHAGPTLPRGRPRNKLNEWARDQVHNKGRDPLDVREEWKAKAEREGRLLADPDASWRAMIKKPPED